MNAERSPPAGPLAGPLPRRALGAWAGAALAGGLAPRRARAQAPMPVLVGIDAEFGVASSAAADAIRRGALCAIEEINEAGGLLGGRPVELELRDNRGSPARAARAFLELAALPDMTAVLGGQLAPTAQEMAGLANRLGLPLLLPWSAVEEIRDPAVPEDQVFRLSMRDRWAMQRLLARATQRGWRRLALLVLNNAWGRSSHAALLAAARQQPDAPEIEVLWHNLTDEGILDQYIGLRRGSVDAVVLVALERQLLALLRRMAALPETERLPLLSHWSIFGNAAYPRQIDAPLAVLDVEAVTTVLPGRLAAAQQERALRTARRLFGVERLSDIPALAGFVHSYDLVHILARAVALAGETRPAGLRAALEGVTDHAGLLRHYPRPFAPGRHEALGLEDVRLGRLRPGGVFEELAV
ncbi:ABC transporter substrate-binding protein [Pseudoroseomonas cervicalis]|uniref:ABC transporter substrate-binding protein n=1 Tax=Teichococcus cervicalis TaxID=204525 RepID=UPI00278460CC|nr:ABC transporter substrate-binding protein [Pseudoroseomonas cervicalis]MDQ1078073.1 branched-chain amino acid transport system substrate-binding protein [Pseudoroseomonas cervicalis]